MIFLEKWYFFQPYINVAVVKNILTSEKLQITEEVFGPRYFKGRNFCGKKLLLGKNTAKFKE